jgi:glycosyltransferase involved in cell wall biosynthesis
VCTRNRSGQLSGALGSLEPCVLPEGWEGELIIVDNGSTDSTWSVARASAMRGRLPVRTIHEARPGLSCARNAGWRASAAELVAFTDDDCRAAPDWIEQIIRAFERHAHVEAVFGQVAAADGADAARTLAVETDADARDYRFGAIPSRIGHGNNMAFRRSTLARVGAFDESLGAGGVLRSAEDLDMAYRLLRQGSVIRYEPAARVFHLPRQEKTQVQADHWRNAVGVGACYGKYALRGDGFAIKCLLWLMADLPASAWREWRAGSHMDLSTKWSYFIGLPCGVLRRAWHDLLRVRPRIYRGRDGPRRKGC